jgi:protein TonB
VAVEPEIAAPTEATIDQTPVAISTLTRTKYVAPKYPRAAQRRNQSGWVDVVFVVTNEGLVRDISIRNSEPGDTFVNSAIKAAEKWQFEPVIENGVAVEKLVGVRMMFALE